MQEVITFTINKAWFFDGKIKGVVCRIYYFCTMFINKAVFFFFNWKSKVDVCRMLSFTINKAWFFQWKNQKATRKPEMTALQTGLGPCNAGAGNRQRSHAAQQPYRYRSASPHYHYRSAPSRPPRWNTSAANLICWSQRRKWSELGKSIELRPIPPPPLPPPPNGRRLFFLAGFRVNHQVGRSQPFPPRRAQFAAQPLRYRRFTTHDEERNGFSPNKEEIKKEKK